MTIWDALFGKKVTISYRDKAGNLVERKITEAQLKQLKASGVITPKKPTIQVHVLELQQSYSTTWEIDNDIPAETVQRFKDPETGAIYVTIFPENGELETNVCSKELWLSLKAQFDAISPKGNDIVDSISELRKQHPGLF